MYQSYRKVVDVSYSLFTYLDPANYAGLKGQLILQLTLLGLCCSWKQSMKTDLTSNNRFVDLYRSRR